MKTLTSLMVVLLLTSGCVSNTSTGVSNADVANVSSKTSTPQLSERNSESDAEEKITPVHFRDIDFKNLAYPIKGTKSPVQLKDGSFNHRHETNNDLGDGWVSLKSVNYANVTGDEAEEAVVQLSRVECGGSCDGGSALFYFYSITNGKLRLLSQIGTGSLAYTCGLKSFVLKKDVLTLEAFRNCRFDGLTLQSVYDADQQGGKFIAPEFTRLALRFNGRWRVITREVLPNPERDVRGYTANIEISND